MSELELIVAENVQKTDRLIDDMGQLVDLSTRSQSDINQLRTTSAENKTAIAKLNTTARAVAKLTVYTQDRFNAIDENIAELRMEMNEL